jgi:hypothetical protein
MGDKPPNDQPTSTASRISAAILCQIDLCRGSTKTRELVALLPSQPLASMVRPPCVSSYFQAFGIQTNSDTITSMDSGG